VTVDDFWRLVEQARAGAKTCCEVVTNATALLSSRPAAEIVATHQALWRLMDASYLQPLWAAAYLIRGGCSDDSFDYFRAYLLTCGRSAFEAAVHDPDSLAGLALPPDPYGDVASCEDMLSIAWDAHLAVTGEDLPDEAWERRERLPLDPAWNFDFDDEPEMRRRLPRLCALYLG
jgi:hypothetical protein